MVPGENVGELPLCFVIMPFVERNDSHPVGFLRRRSTASLSLPHRKQGSKSELQTVKVAT